MSFFMSFSATVRALAWIALPLGLVAFSSQIQAQENESARNIMIVFDASGSMWGQIDGRTKIEIARETLASVLEESASNNVVGMIAYGHRQKGQCSDIQLLVPPGPAAQSVPAIIQSANGLQPKGKTPLSDAVRQAAEDLNFTENEATVVLITDGIETCNADPCALGRELENAGINFTTHVVGFGLSQDEGQKVACLAENTGGRYIEAGNADQLNDALRQTIEADASDFDDAPAGDAPRMVRFILRDTEGGRKLTTRQFDAITVEPRDAEDRAEGFTVYYEDKPWTASATMTPGDYDLLIDREDTSGRYKTKITVTVEPGEGEQIIDKVLAASLHIRTFISAGEELPAGKAVPSAVSNPAQANYHIFPVDNGVMAEKRIANGYRGFNEALPPGDYVIRGTFARTITREKFVHLDAGQNLEFDFNFELSRIYVDARDANGLPVSRQTTYLYDRSEGTHFRNGGGGAEKDGTRKPFFLPKGVWRLSAGRDGGGKTRSTFLVAVPGEGEDINIRVGEGGRLSEDEIGRLDSASNPGCLGIRGAEHDGCVVEEADIGGSVGDEAGSAQDLAPDSADFEDEDQPQPPNEGNGGEKVSPWDVKPSPQKDAQNTPSVPLPVGVFGYLPTDSFDEEDGMLAAGIEACTQSPTVIYPDGLMRVTSYDQDTASFSTAVEMQCTMGARFDCGPVDGGASDLAVSATLEDIGAQSYRMCDAKGCHVLWSCFGSGAIAPDAALPGGKSAFEAIVARDDGGPLPPK